MSLETIISQVPIFAALPPSELSYLAKTLQQRHVPAQTFLFVEGGRDRMCYILLEGHVEVIKNLSPGEDRQLTILGKGEIVGEMSLFSENSSHTASVRSVTPARVLEMTLDDFNALLHRQPSLTYDVVRLLSQRLERSDNATISELQEKNTQLTAAYLELQQAQAQLIEKKKLEHELAIARDIQRQILPHKLPLIDRYEFGALMVPARVIGGDFYNFIPLDDDRLGIVVGDVTDKGIPAALFMSLVYSLIRVESLRCSTPIETLSKVNQHLLSFDASGMFVTTVYGILDYRNNVFHFVRAGHPYPIILDNESKEILSGKIFGQPIGIFKDVKFEEKQMPIHPGDKIMIISDGVFERENNFGQEFGLERTKDLFISLAHLPPQEICNRVFTELHNFGMPNQSQDDVTIVVIHAKN